MRARRRVIDLSNYERQTYFQKRRVDDTLAYAKQLENDPDRAGRIEKSLCPICHYMSGRIGGAAMTSVQCGLCDEDMCFGSTCVDALCLSCAKKSGLCKRCGADVNLKRRRKVSFSPTPSLPDDSD